MLVSTEVTERLRVGVAAGRRPCPEYLRLEADYGVELLDWSHLGRGNHARSVWQSVRHASLALRRRRDVDVIFSDGEHVGLPVALTMMARRWSTPHLVIGHHLNTRAKRPLFKVVRAHRGMSRIMVHSHHQLERAQSELAIPRYRLRYVPYGVDTDFWRPLAIAEDSLVLTTGRDHRDFSTLAAALGGAPERVFVTGASAHSPRAYCREPSEWPANFDVGFVDALALRELYARASVVVVPLIETDFQAGITALLEAMAMGKATVVSMTAGLRGITRDGENAVHVPPGDVAALAQAVGSLIQRPDERARLGRTARAAVERDYSLDQYARVIADNLADVHASAGRS